METILEMKECFTIAFGEEQYLQDEAGMPSRAVIIAAQKHLDESKTKATAILFISLGDKPLKVVQKHSKSPDEM